MLHENILISSLFVTYSLIIIRHYLVTLIKQDAIFASSEFIVVVIVFILILVTRTYVNSSEEYVLR